MWPYLSRGIRVRIYETTYLVCGIHQRVMQVGLSADFCAATQQTQSLRQVPVLETGFVGLRDKAANPTYMAAPSMLFLPVAHSPP